MTPPVSCKVQQDSVAPKLLDHSKVLTIITRDFTWSNVDVCFVALYDAVLFGAAL